MQDPWYSVLPVFLPSTHQLWLGRKKTLCCAQPLLRDCRSVLKELMPFLEAAAGAAVGGIAKMSNLWFVPA